MSKHGGTRCQVVGCGRPAHGAYICEPCLYDDLHVKLGDVPALAHALNSAYLREQRFSIAGIGIPNPDEASVPFNDKASAARRELTRLLLDWWLRVDQHQRPRRWHPPLVLPPNTPATAEAMSAYLIDHLDWFRAQPSGPAAVAQFRDWHKRALLAVDRPPDLVYLGVCSWPIRTERGRVVEECPEDLYAEWGKDTTRCRRCKNQHDVKNRKSVLLNAVNDQLANASDIARGLSSLGMKVTAERIRQWKVRGRIEEKSTSYRGHPLYRVGDVIDLVLADLERIKSELKKGTKA